MRARSSFLLAAGALAASVSSASAAEVSPAGAAALTETLETYLGRPAPGVPRVVTVTPAGEAYALDLDLDVLAAPIKAFAVDVRAGHWRSTLTPLPDGTWRQTFDSIGPFAVAVPGGQTIEVRFDGLAADSVFDPALVAFTRQSLSIRTLTSRSSKPANGTEPGLETEETRSDFRLDGTARAAAGGSGVDIEASQTIGKTAQTIALQGGGSTGVPDMTFTLGLAGYRADIAATALRSVGLRDLWAHLVAHHGETDFTAGQGAFKAKLRDALPLFDRIRQSMTGTGLSVETPFGFAEARELGAAIDVAGLVRDGRFEFGLHLDGLKANSILIPPWIGKLIPTDLTVAVKGSGYDLATPLSIALDKADFAAPKPLPPEEAERLKALVLPRGTMEIDLSGNRLRGNGWEATVDGRLTAGETGAVGALTVRATGIEAIERALADPKAGDEGKKALATLAMAKSFAERREDALVWRFDFDHQAVSVNGRPLPGRTPPAGGLPAPTPNGPGGKKMQAL